MMRVALALLFAFFLPVQAEEASSVPASDNAVAGLAPADMDDLGHGSTVATNAVLERKGARVAFVTTAGFRDILFLQRHTRRNIYDLHYQKPAPVVRRADCFEVRERVLSDGSVDEGLDETAIRSGLLPALEQGRYDAVAVCPCGVCLQGRGGDRPSICSGDHH